MEISVLNFDLESYLSSILFSYLCLAFRVTYNIMIGMRLRG